MRWLLIACCLAAGCGQRPDPFDVIAIQVIEDSQTKTHLGQRRDANGDYLSWADAVRRLDREMANDEWAQERNRVSQREIDKLLETGDQTVRHRLEFVAAEITKRGFPRSIFAFQQLTIYKRAVDYFDNPQLYQ